MNCDGDGEGASDTFGITLQERKNSKGLSATQRGRESVRSPRRVKEGGIGPREAIMVKD